MSQSIGIKSSPTGPFVYVENTVGESLAFGSDNTAQMFVLNTSASPNAIPATASANINFDPTANGNITFRPNGSGKINALNVASNVVSNKNYVTINTSTGELGSDNSPLTSVSITGDTGGALSGSSFTFTGGTTGLSFGGSGNTETLSITNLNLPGSNSTLTSGCITSGGTVAFKSFIGSRNLFLGELCGNGTFTTANNNYAMGYQSLLSITTGEGNSCLGLNAGYATTSGNFNTNLGFGCGQSITSGSHNLHAGQQAGVFHNGNYNVMLGAYQTGVNCVGTESSNLYINTPGVASENNTIRIGTQGTGNAQQNTCYIAGIASVGVSNKNYVTINTVTGQLGSDNAPLTSVSITGDSGGALSGSSFTFTGGTTGLTFAGAATTETLGGTLVVSNGGTGNTTFTAYSVLCAGTTATGAFQNVSGVGSAGQVLTSNGAGALPTWQAAAASGFTWNDVTGASASMAVSNGYAANNAGLVTLTLPAIAAFGSIVEVAGNGAGGWLIAQNAGQVINFGTSSTTVGVAGSVASTNRYDSIRLLCVTANTTWVALSAVGNLTIT